MALHPLLFDAWLTVWWSLLDPRQLYPRDHGWFYTLILEVPYALALASRYYLLILFVVGVVLAAERSFRRVVKPLGALLVVWATTWVMLEWNLLEMRDWFWD